MTTYAQLTQDVRDEIKDTEVTDAIAQGFIAKAEFRISRDLVNPALGSEIPHQMLTLGRQDTDTFKNVQLPDNFLRMRSVWLAEQLQEYVPPSFLVEYDPGQDPQRTTYWYYAALSPLASQGGGLANNWLLTDAYDVYLWGACLQFEAWGHEDQPQFRRWYTEAIQNCKTTFAAQPQGRYGMKRKPPTYGGYSIVGQQMRFL